MLKRLYLAITVSIIALNTVRAEPVKFEAILKEHAILPAQTFTVPPSDAPNALNATGRFINNKRNELLNSDIVPASGLAVPFAGQPIQGFSGTKTLGDNRFLILTDNGFGTRTNSSDAMLMYHIIKIDWNEGRPKIEKTVFFKRPKQNSSFSNY